jgi:ankyrin repeat protein
MAQDGLYGSPLIAAAECGTLDIVRRFVECGADVNSQVPGGDFGSALEAACLADRQDLELLRYLIQKGANVNLVLQHGRHGSALAGASLWGRVDCVKVLLEAGADANLRLDCESYGTAIEAARALPSFERQKDYFFKLSSNRKGWDAIEKAMPKNKEEVLRMLEQSVEAQRNEVEKIDQLH